MLLQENIPLAPLTTFHLGGPAHFFVEAKSIADVEEAARLARSKDLPLFVLGGGSNLLVADSGWPGRCSGFEAISGADSLGGLWGLLSLQELPPVP